MLALKAADTWPHAASLAASAPVLPQSCSPLGFPSWELFSPPLTALLMILLIFSTSSPAPPCLTPSRSQPFLFALLSRQYVSPQNAVCPAPWTLKEDRKNRKHKLWKAQAPLPARAPFMRTLSLPGHPGPGDSREPWKAPQFFCSSFKTTTLSNEGTVLFVNSRLQQQWEGLICNPRYHHAPPRVPSPAAFCRQDTRQQMRREHRSPAWQEGNWLPIPLSARQNFFAAIHTFQWAGYKQPPDGFGGSEGNDTRDYKSITIIEPFIR